MACVQRWPMLCLYQGHGRTGSLPSMMPDFSRVPADVLCHCLCEAKGEERLRLDGGYTPYVPRPSSCELAVCSGSTSLLFEDLSNRGMPLELDL